MARSDGLGGEPPTAAPENERLAEQEELNDESEAAEEADSDSAEAFGPGPVERF